MRISGTPLSIPNPFAAIAYGRVTCKFAVKYPPKPGHRIVDYRMSCEDKVVAREDGKRAKSMGDSSQSIRAGALYGFAHLRRQ